MPRIFAVALLFVGAVDGLLLSPGALSPGAGAVRRVRVARPSACPTMALPDDDDDVPDSLPDSLDMGLLKMPRLTTPERASFEAYRERMQKRAAPPEPEDTPPGPTLLGQDPVEGEPVDLRPYFSDAYQESPTPKNPDEAREMFERSMRSEEEPTGYEPDGFGDGIEGLL